MPTLLPKPPPMSGEMIWILCSGNAGDQGVDGAVRVRGLIGRVHQQFAGHRVHAGDRAAGLHRRGMHSGIEHLLRDDDLGGVEHRRGLRGVARFPVEDVVVGLALDVVPDHRGAGIQRALGVDHRRQRLVVDLDQFQRVAGDVLGVGDDVRDLLVLEPHLVGGQHGLHVGGQGRHPGQARAPASVSPVITACTPGSAAAAVVSMDRIRAWAYGLRRIAECSMPGMVTSST